jgi:hypothetical protein
MQALIEIFKIPSPLHAPLALYSIIDQQVKLARSLRDMFKTCKQLPIGVLQQRLNKEKKRHFRPTITHAIPHLKLKIGTRK